MPKSIILPCGTPATVEAFTGTVTRLLADQDASKDRMDTILREVTLELGGRKDQRLSDKNFLELPSGSRLRLLIEARRLTYGDEVEVVSTCVHCAAKGKQVNCERTVDLSDVDDVAYPEGMAPFDWKGPDGRVYRLGWGTGRTERSHLQAATRRQVSAVDEVFFRVLMVDDHDEGFLALGKLPETVLTPLRATGRRMTPILYLEGAAPRFVPEDAPPQGGPRSRIQVACDECGKRQFVALESAQDFLGRGLLATVQE